MIESPDYAVDRDTCRLRLRDGRILAYSEHGDPDGYPVFFFHGNPGSRHMRHPDESIVERLGIRLIAPERPGYGLSTFQSRRRLLDFPRDIERLAEALNLDEFAVFGVSAGGPYVAACAYMLPEVSRAAIVSGVTPLNRVDAYQGMNIKYRLAFQMAGRLPNPVVFPAFRAHTQTAVNSPDSWFAEVETILSPADIAIINRPAVRQQIKRFQAEAVRQGVRGIVHEIKILTMDYGFRLDDIETDVDLWYWEDDVIVPPQMGVYMAEHIPMSVPHFFTGGGHFAIYDAWEMILTQLLEA